jgi:hypothetical protein
MVLIPMMPYHAPTFIERSIRDRPTDRGGCADAKTALRPLSITKMARRIDESRRERQQTKLASVVLPDILALEKHNQFVAISSEAAG